MIWTLLAGRNGSIESSSISGKGFSKRGVFDSGFSFIWAVARLNIGRALRSK